MLRTEKSVKGLFHKYVLKIICYHHLLYADFFIFFETKIYQKIKLNDFNTIVIENVIYGNIKSYKEAWLYTVSGKFYFEKTMRVDGSLKLEAFCS